MRSSVLILIFCSACAREPKTEKVSPVGVVFGDSIAFGTGAVPGADLANCLTRRTGRTFINRGTPGLSTREASDHLPSVLALNPKVVVLSLGGNDLLRDLSARVSSAARFPPEETLQNLESLFRAFSERGIHVLYVNMSPPVVWSNPRSVYARADGRLARIEELVKRHAGAEFVANAMEGLWQNPARMADEIHPNSNGYALMCERLASRL